MFKKIIKSVPFVGLLFALGASLAEVNSWVDLPKVSAQGIVVEDSDNVYLAANITQGETEYRDEVEASPGEVIQLLVMVHLGEEGTSADDISVRVNLSESKVLRPDGKYELVTKAFIDSSENDVEDGTRIIVPSNQDLVFIPEHGVIVTSHGTLPSNVPETPYDWPDPAELFGEGIDLGGMGGISTAHISFKVYVSNKTANMSITKEVANVTNPDGVWHEEIAAARGDRVRFQIVVKNTGASELNDILITDQLPDGLEYVLGSSEYSTPYSSGFKPLADSWITGEGGVSQANLGKLPIGEGCNAIIVFDAKVRENASEGQYKNVAQAKANEYPNWIYDRAAVNIRIEKGEAELSIEKFVRWEGTDDWYESIEKDEYLFDPGEKVVYKIVVKNTGEVGAENVRVVDELPDYIKWISGDGEWDDDKRKVRFYLGTVEAGEEIVLKYTAKVFDEDDLPFTDREQKNVATLYQNEKKIDDDHAQVWINGPEVLAAKVEKPEELPEAGADSLGLILISVGMIISGWGTKRLAMGF